MVINQTFSLFIENSECVADDQVEICLLGNDHLFEFLRLFTVFVGPVQLPGKFLDLFENLLLKNTDGIDCGSTFLGKG
jgi:hypothetical protein